MFSLDDDEQAARFDDVAASDTSTYRDVVEALGPNFEGGYFLYRFSDPTYIVADAVVRAVAGTTLKDGGRAIDICGGSGHLTRTLIDVSTAPVLADLYFSKIWLARRFTAPGCEAVCCDGNGPFPFARGAFRYAMCTDAFMYIWTKRLFVGEMTRLVDGQPGASVVIGHTHNERTWTPFARTAARPGRLSRFVRSRRAQDFRRKRTLRRRREGRPAGSQPPRLGGIPRRRAGP
jgi:hypothetical protein